MLQKSCERCVYYHTGLCKLYDFYLKTPISIANDCGQFTTVKTTKQTCTNCVHYRDKRCFLHNFDVENPEYSASLCAEFTPINTQKSEKEMSEKSCKDCKRYYKYNGVSHCDAHNCLINLDKNDHITFANDCPDYTHKFEKTLEMISENKTSQQDPINPSYYRNGKVSCIDAMESATVNKKGDEAVSVGLIIKYLWRYEEKGGMEDVKKCQWYINRLLKVLEEKDETD